MKKIIPSAQVHNSPEDLISSLNLHLLVTRFVDEKNINFYIIQIVVIVFGIKKREEKI